MINKKKLAYKTALYSGVGLALVGSSLLISVSNNQHVTKSSVSLNSSDVNKKLDNAQQSNANVIVRSNPTNGFNGLETHDGKYTYVLITNAGATADAIGGANSGIASIDNATGAIVGTWNLPSDEIFKLNYTTNIVFGQTADGKFDETKLFVLCGISNLAAAINNVYTGYDAATHSLTTDLSKGPTIKIFSLDVSTSGTFTNNLGQDTFYNFAYPSDGTNGYAGFNKDGYIYDMQNVQNSTDGLNSSLYTASGIDFKGITRLDSNHGLKFTEITNTTIGAFGSYITYLTYGQNFAYHLGKTYESSTTYNSKPEFIMTTSFVNVDQNLGGLYSATVRNTVNGVTASDGYWDWYNNGATSHAAEQSNWPIPFGYQWLLADIADKNKDEATKDTHDNVTQYTYVDAKGDTVDVTWGSALALNAPIINFLNDTIFPSASADEQSWFGSTGVNLMSAISLGHSGRFAANWGQSTGYIIFTPSASSTAASLAPFSVDDYRYYYLAELVETQFTNNWYAMTYATSSLFTNVLATDKLSSDGSISYLMGLAWCKDSFYTNYPAVNTTPYGKFSTLFSPSYTTMVVYDWETISNDDAKNSIMVPAASEIDKATTTFGDLNDYYNTLQPKTNPANDNNATSSNASADLKNSFKNWSLVYFGAPSNEGQNKMESYFCITPNVYGDAYSFLIAIVKPNNIGSEKKLGLLLTYLRKKISFIIHPLSGGVVLWTAADEFSWRSGFGWFGVNRGFGDGKDEWTSYLKDWAGSWGGNDEISAIKEISKQPYGNYANGTMKVLAFVTPKGIYSIAGIDSAGIDPSTWNGSLAYFLYDTANGGANWYGCTGGELIKAMAFSPFTNVAAGTSGYGVSSPAVTISASNNLTMWTSQTPDLYSMQVNSDYLISNANPNAPSYWLSGPASKPAVKVNDNAIDASSIQVHVGSASDQSTWLKYEQLETKGLDQIFGTVLTGLSTSATSSLNYYVNTNFDVTKYGAIIQPGSYDNQFTSAIISIPVIYKNISNDITYYASIKNGNSYGVSYTLTGLQPSKYAPVLIVLNNPGVINQKLIEMKLTAQQVVDKYGQAYDKTLAAEFNQIVVNISDTNTYLFTDHGDYFTQGKFVYWAKPSLSGTGGITISVWYKKDSIDPDWTHNANLCNSDDYVNGQVQGNTFTNSNVSGYQPPIEFPTVSGNSNTGVIIGAVIAALVAVTVALGLGIGLPMRKQHKINVLNSKITNKRIDKLSTAVSASFKKVIEATSTISKQVNRLETNQNRVLAAARSTPAPTPGAPAKPGSAPSAPRPVAAAPAPGAPIAPRPAPIAPNAPHPVAAPGAPVRPTPPVPGTPTKPVGR